MATTQGGAKITMLAQVAGTKPTFTATNADGTSVSGYITPELASASLRQISDTQRTMNYQGDVVAVHSSGLYYECTFRLIPFGTTGANAKTSAQILSPMATFNIDGLPIVAAAPFTDIFNVTSGGVQANLWIYEDGATLDLSNNSDAGMSLTLRRYPSIAGGTAINS